MWQDAVKPFVESGQLLAIGVVQEQHPDRTLLYRQWRDLDWPIFVDALGTLDHVRVVPIPVGIDAGGTVRYAQLAPDQLDAFMKADYGATPAPAGFNVAVRPDVAALERAAQRAPTATAWRDLAWAHFNFGGTDGLDPAARAMQFAIDLEPGNGLLRFGLGGILRRRAESSSRREGDAQAAVDAWTLANEIDPNQYIWRRRIEQYGPRLVKPYNFYFWVDEARSAIRARGGTPIALAAEPMGSEILDMTSAVAVGAPLPDRDPAGRVDRDVKRLVRIETMVTPARRDGRARSDRRVRARVTFRLDEATTPYWNNESRDLYLHVNLPDGFTLGEHKMTFDNPPIPETREPRSLEFEINVGEGTRPGRYDARAYALYYVCEDARGVCLYLRQNFTLTFEIRP